MAPRKIEKVMRKDKRRKSPKISIALTIGEVNTVCAVVQDTDVQNLAEKVKTNVREELHLEYGDRVLILDHLDKAGLTRLLSLFINIFVTLYRDCFKSEKFADRYVIFQTAWLGVVAGAISTTCDVKLGPVIQSQIDMDQENLPCVWSELTKCIFLQPITKHQHEDLSAIIHSIAAATLNILSEKVKNNNANTEKRVQEIRQFHEETEYGLFSVAGGCIHSIKKNLFKTPLHQRSRNKALLDVLFACIRTKIQKEATQIPTGLAFRDRGGLLVPQRVFLPWLRQLDRTIRLHASDRGLATYGRQIIKMTVQQVSSLSAIQDLFIEGAKYACRMKGLKPRIPTLQKMHTLWQQKIVHARVNEFITAHQLREAEQQGLPLTRGGFTLRDDLYSIASNSK